MSAERAGNLEGRDAGTARRPREAARVRALAGTIAPPLVVLVLIVAFWQALIAVFGIASYLLPTPGQVAQAAWTYRDDLQAALWNTLRAALIALVLSTLLGLLAAVVITRHKLLERGLLPYATVLQTIPIIAFAPLIIIWMGTGDVAIITIAVVVSVFPIIANATLGLLSTDHNLMNLATMYNAGPWQQLIKLRVPAALPFILTGVRISSGLCVIGAIVGEWFAGTGGDSGGLGYIIQVTDRNLQVDELFAATLLASIMGILVFLAVNALSYLWLHNWHESSIRREN